MSSDADSLMNARSRLAETIAERTCDDGDHGDHDTALGGLSLCRHSTIEAPSVHVHEPSLCILVQGAKRVVAGGQAHDYDETQCLVTSIDLPTTTRVSRATSERPCLGLTFRLDVHAIGQLLADMALPRRQVASTGRTGISVGAQTTRLLDALRRLVELVDHLDDAPILRPLLEREILYWLLIGDQGHHLRQLALTGSRTHRIAKAANWIKARFATRLSVDRLAGEAGMSTSSFRQQFRAVTSMSPLQYQKQLRLHEARRLMLTERVEAAAAALRVGYESHTQFSREYKRLFGAPPIRDIARLRSHRSRVTEDALSLRNAATEFPCSWPYAYAHTVSDAPPAEEHGDEPLHSRIDRRFDLFGMA